MAWARPVWRGVSRKLLAVNCCWRVLRIIRSWSAFIATRVPPPGFYKHIGVKTRQAAVLFEAPVATGLVGHLIGALSGASLYRRASFLTDSLGRRILPKADDAATARHFLSGNVEAVHTASEFSLSLDPLCATPAVDPASRVPVVGASGAVAGVLAAYMVIFPTGDDFDIGRVRRVFHSVGEQVGEHLLQ